MNIETSNSPNPNFSNNNTENNEASNKIKDNMNAISKILCDKLKRKVKDVNTRFQIKTEERQHPPNLEEYFNKIKKELNK